MSNGRSAIKDWTKALEQDPSFAHARLARLDRWVRGEMKDDGDTHSECVTFLGLVHKDYRELNIIYAILAHTTFGDPRLGTYADAMEWHTKSLQATNRMVELYGLGREPAANDILRHTRKWLKMLHDDPENVVKERKEWDTSLDMYQHQYRRVDKSMRNSCINCGKHERMDGILLRKCGRCKRVYYCSEECIRAVS
jgi:MYND finger